MCQSGRSGSLRQGTDRSYGRTQGQAGTNGLCATGVTSSTTRVLRISVRGLRRLIVFLVVLSVACFVVAAVTYESTPSGWFSYTPLSQGPDPRGDHWPWLSAGAAFLVSAAAVAVTGWAGRRKTG